jgi:hypothetical protein
MAGKIGSFSKEKDLSSSDLSRDSSMIAARKTINSTINNFSGFEMTCDMDFMITATLLF